MGKGPSQQYLCKYNSYVLPGYVQSESLPSEMTIVDHYAPYADGSPSEYTGLVNKALTVSLKVWDETFAQAKEEVQLAATYLRSKRAGFAPLYLEYSDRHYDALVKTIAVTNQAGGIGRLMTYDVNFECRPWLIEDAYTTISGTGTITTDLVSRDLTKGTWTPTTITVTGTDVTISGYTSTGDFTGYISISGAVVNMIIDAENYTATISGINRNDLMNWVDYQVLVGTGKTSFTITGASSCEIKWQNRWSI